MNAFPIAASLVAAMSLGAVPASAQALREVRHPRVDFTFIWKDETARREGFGLIQAGTNRTRPELLTRLVACAPANGTRITVLEPGTVTSTIAVAEGHNAGCRGIIMSNEIGPLTERGPLPAP
ncbi:hypothetical protein [Plastoroseomonas hellenica]|uniref:hypothetical protein n=1 Tax=Plastoroseomonas hellenica TaxID=2687306 RepID=UPI001BAB977D|nr:hypothetical protein [Plastoroseomonas hellenica]MBR0644023.1 hypothetical protein [Plastoroseomonas hellenica]